MQKKNLTSLTRIFSILSLIVILFVQCTDPEIAPDNAEFQPQALTTSQSSSCGCTYTVAVNAGTQTIDAQKLGIKEGAVICLEGNKIYGNLVFKYLKGTAAKPITIKNCGGTATINATGKPDGLKVQRSTYVHIDGGTGTTYGIKVNGGHKSVTIEDLSTNVEINNLEVYNSGFSGIMAKTDPTCDVATQRGNFVMRDVIIHDNYVHDTGGESFYIGHSMWLVGATLSCGKKYPHEMAGVKIYNNIIKNSGWESIQVGSTPTGAEVYDNRIENYGVKNGTFQNNGIQFGEGSAGSCYRNFIKGGKGHGLIIVGSAQVFAYDNVIINAGGDGIFCEDRVTGPGFKFINNTIINPTLHGIRLYSDEVSMNNVLNNIIVNPGNYSKMVYPRKGDDAYIYVLNSKVKKQILNNYQTRDINTVKFISPSADDYGLQSSATAVLNKGTSISSYGITLDHVKLTRVKGAAVDIGAYERQQ